MNFTLLVLDVRGKGVEVATPASTGGTFWLPRGVPVVWSEPPEPGAKVNATIPKWLALKHSQLVALRGQYALPLIPEPGLDPEKAKAPIPMAADYPQDAGKGAIYRNSKAEKPSHPSHTGFCDISGVRYRIAAWVRTNETTGEKFFSLSFREAGEQQASKPQQPAHAPRDDSTIPF